MGLQERFAGVDQRKDDIDNMDNIDIIMEMKRLADRYATPAAWGDFEMTDKAKGVLTEVNNSRTRQLPFKWDHLEGVTFKTGFVKVDDDTPMMTEEDHKIMIAMVRIHTEQACVLPGAKSLGLARL